MNLTTKETELLKDLKNQEQLCVGKYDRYSQDAKSPELQTLFRSMADTERGHLQTITQMMSGQVDPVPTTIGNGDNCNCGAASYPDEESRKYDAFLCQDMLTMEKHASSLYNTCVFEFTTPQARKMLNHIQAEEQQHGEQLYTYMSNNQMQA